MIGTAFLSGIFGMAGGLILIGVLLVVFPLPTAMVLHAMTQMASNGWRAILWWRHIVWKSMAFYVAGCLVVGRPVVDLRSTCPTRRWRCCCSASRPSSSGRSPTGSCRARFGPAQVAATGFVSMMLMLTDRRHRAAARHHVPALAARAAADHRHQGRLPGVRPRLQADLLRRADRAGRPGRAVVPRASPSPRRSSAPRSASCCSSGSPTRSSASGRTG